MPEETVQPEEPQKGIYGPNDKPKGKATVIPDDPVEQFPENPDAPKEQ